MNKIRVRADFNGLFGDILCLSHGDSCLDQWGETVVLHHDMELTAYHGRDDRFASGAVEPSPDWLECPGSRWVLRIDSRGVQREPQGS